MGSGLVLSRECQSVIAAKYITKVIGRLHIVALRKIVCKSRSRKPETILKYIRLQYIIVFKCPKRDHESIDRGGEKLHIAALRKNNIKMQGENLKLLTWV